MSDMDKVVQTPEPEGTATQGPVITRRLDPGAEASPRPRRPETVKLDMENDPQPGAGASPARLGLTRQEMNWAAAAHASILLSLLLGVATGGIGAILGPIVPGLIWYAHRDQSAYVTEQARQATIFQLAGLAALLALAIAGALLVAVGWTVSAILVIVLVGLILLPVMLVVTLLWVVGIVALPILQVVYGCYAALEAYNGRRFRYWWIADLIDRYQAQSQP